MAAIKSVTVLLVGWMGLDLVVRNEAHFSC
jgi:hypothetical protein